MTGELLLLLMAFVKPIDVVVLSPRAEVVDLVSSAPGWLNRSNDFDE